MLDYTKLKNWQPEDVRQSYTLKDTILYNLGLGFGSDPTNPDELRYVYENGLATLPTMCSVLGSPGFWMKDHPEFGIDYLRLVHGEQRVTTFAALPPQGTVLGRTRVTSIVDKGAAKGALLTVERRLLDAQTQDPIASIEQVLFLRGNGGFSESGPSDAAAPADNFVADREPDSVLRAPIAANTALLYRLSGDWNPLHADPEVARKAGFDRPILHGLATYGIACRLLATTICSSGPKTSIKFFAARLSAPVFPGETLELSYWLQGARIRFEASVAERHVKVLSNGIADLH